MVPTREATIEQISLLSDADYKKVAIFVQNVQGDTTADNAEVEALMNGFNKKYENAFRALAQ